MKASYRIVNECIAFWNRISVAAAIAQFLYLAKPVLTARVHTQTKEIPTHKRRLHHWHVAKLIFKIESM